MSALDSDWRSLPRRLGCPESEWLEAVQVVERYLDSKKQQAEDEDVYQYLACAWESQQSASASEVRFSLIVSDFLEESGFERARSHIDKS